MAEEPAWRRLEKRAEEIYDEMYETSSSLGYLSEIKECFYDAIQAAEKDGLPDEARRLEARRDHIVAVYRSQFVQPPSIVKSTPRLVGNARPFDVLLGLNLSIARRAADMLMLHFGEIRPHSSGEGTVGTFAFHIQCAWRFARGNPGIVTGSGDLWRYAGPGERPDNWTFSQGGSLQDHMLGELIGGYDEETRSWYNRRPRLIVKQTMVTALGDVLLDFGEDNSFFAVFPDTGIKGGESWRFFASDGGEHLVYGGETRQEWK